MNFKQLKTWYECIEYGTVQFKKNIDAYMEEGGPYDPFKYLFQEALHLKFTNKSAVLKAKDSDGKEKPFRSLFQDPQRRLVLSFEDFPKLSSTERVGSHGTDITAAMLLDFAEKTKDQEIVSLVFQSSDGEKKKF